MSPAELRHRAELKTLPGRFPRQKDREFPSWGWGIVGRTQSCLSPIPKGATAYTVHGVSGYEVMGGASRHHSCLGG